MAIPKVMGTEVEYGITVKGDPDFDPISSCVLLVNAYREDHAGEILWDYDQENPLADLFHYGNGHASGQIGTGKD
jgi:proteasome accessory factor A